MAAGFCHLKMPDVPMASEECDMVVFYISTRRGLSCDRRKQC
jgi:hypothetical protein